MNNWYLLAAIPVFGICVLVHEFGHFITAKWAGIRVEEFGLGFPPRLVGIRRRDEGGWEVIWFGGKRHAEDSYADLKQSPFSGTSGGIRNPGSPADMAGIRPGDTIVLANGQPVQLFSDVQNIVTNAIAADNNKHATLPVALQVKHSGENQVVSTTVYVRERPPAGQGPMGIEE